MSSSERKALIALREKRGDVHKKAKHDKDKQQIAAIVTQTIASLKTTKDLFSQRLQVKKMKKRKQVVAVTGITRHNRENDARLSPVLLLSHMVVHL